MSSNSGTIWTAVGAIASVAGVIFAVLSSQSPHPQDATVTQNAAEELSPGHTVVPSGLDKHKPELWESLSQPADHHKAFDVSTSFFQNGSLINLQGESSDRSFDFRLIPNGVTGQMMLQTSSAKTADISDQPPDYNKCHNAEYSSDDVYVRDAIHKWMCVQTKDNAVLRIRIDDGTENGISIHIEGWT